VFLNRGMSHLTRGLFSWLRIRLYACSPPLETVYNFMVYLLPPACLIFKGPMTSYERLKPVSILIIYFFETDILFLIDIVKVTIGS
jgi:hypothetical protein